MEEHGHGLTINHMQTVESFDNQLYCKHDWHIYLFLIHAFIVFFCVYKVIRRFKDLKLIVILNSTKHKYH